MQFGKMIHMDHRPTLNLIGISKFGVSIFNTIIQTADSPKINMLLSAVRCFVFVRLISRECLVVFVILHNLIGRLYVYF